MSCKAYESHPVIAANTGHWSDVEVISLFSDGVQYTKRDSFIGFYIRNLRTNIEEMAFVVRTLLHIWLDLILTGLRTRLCMIN
jgi:hypothetical protein